MQKVRKMVTWTTENNNFCLATCAIIVTGYAVVLVLYLRDGSYAGAPKALTAIPALILGNAVFFAECILALAISNYSVGKFEGLLAICLLIPTLITITTLYFKIYALVGSYRELVSYLSVLAIVAMITAIILYNLVPVICKIKNKFKKNS